MAIELTTEERSKLRRALITAGRATRGLADDELVKEAERHTDYFADSEQKVTTQPQPVTSTDVDADAVDSPEAPQPAPDAPEAPNVGDMFQQFIQQQMTSHILRVVRAEMAAAAVNEDRIAEIVRRESSRPRPVNITINDAAQPEREPVRIDDAHPVMPEMLEIIEVYPVTLQAPYLVGPAGSGKTTLAMMAADALSRDFYFTGAVTDKFELTGFKDAGGNYDPTPFYKAFKYGGVFLFDEMDGSAPDAILAFNMALANLKFAFPNGEAVEAHKDFLPIAGANTRGTGATRQYIGRNPLDGASLDRFHQIEVQYSETIEISMAERAASAFAKTDVSAQVAEFVANVQLMRKWLDENNSDVIISPRKTKQGAALIGLGWSVKKARESVLFAHLTEDQKRQVRREIQEAA